MNLSKGTTLIEASAGSGKTYTLCRIVLRLILIENVSIDRILAVTFTTAATAELKDRIRSLLQDCLVEINKGEIKEDVLTEAQEHESLATLKQRLQLSLDAFDEAQISTIHGFCKRALDFIPLESGMPFDASFEQVEDDMIERLRNEYIISHIYDHSPLLAALGLANITKIEETLKEVGRQTATHPYAELRPKPQKHFIESLTSLFVSTVENIPKIKETLDPLIPNFNKRSKLYKALIDPTFYSSLEKMAARGYPNKDDINTLTTLSEDAFAKALTKTIAHTDLPPVLEVCDRFITSLTHLPHHFAHHYRSFLHDRLRTLKELSGTISFDDLLHILNRAINSEQSSTIQTDLGALYDAVLIDEFQDTDPVQYNILNTLFGQGDHHLYYIGDPKQAIYSFRGADIQTYFQATQIDSIRTQTLGTNYRSTPEMVAGSNAFFTLSEESFVLDAIEFEAATAKPTETPPKAPSPHSAPGLRFEVLPPEGSKTGQREEQSIACKDDILALVSEGVTPKEMAVLVNNRFEADLIYNILSKTGIPCEIRSERSIFQTQEMDTICLLLTCLARPAQAALQKSLLGNALFGLTWEGIDSPTFTETHDRLSDFLYEWRKDWDQSLFTVTFQRMLRAFSCIDRLAENANFERSYSNFLQLAEIASDAQNEANLSPQSLVNWLRRRQDQSSRDEEAWQTRLQSDSGKLQITTIFSSKGLEYGYVFLPYMSQMDAFKDKGLFVYHSPDSPDAQMIIELGSQEDSTGETLAKRESLAERARLIYVALTRAVNQTRAYLTLPSIPKSSKKPPSLPPIIQLMIGLDVDGLDTASLHERIHAKLDQMQNTPNSGISWTSRAPTSEGSDQSTLTNADLTLSSSPSTETERHARPFTLTHIPYGRRVSSFSALSQQVSSHSTEVAEVESKDKDELPTSVAETPIDDENEEALSTEPDIHNFLKGAKTGDLLHAILENLDFTQKQTVSDLVNQCFEQHQFGYFEYKNIVAQQIETLIETPLQADFTEFPLNAISPKNKIPELEFVYPVDNGFMDRLTDALEQYGSDRFPASWIERLKSSPLFDLQAMLRGFIDLIVEHEGKLYIIDWKSNYLGPTAASYTQEALSDAMEHHDYFLQYCIYIVALKRFIETRFPHSHFDDLFGGVFYIFIRGIQTSEQSGIYFDRPNAQLIEALDHALGGKPHSRHI